MAEKLYLVTGAAGLLGSNITKKLIQRGERVRALVLDGDPAVRHVPKEAESIFGDITDMASLERFFAAERGTEVYVIHCAGIVTVNADLDKKVYMVNVNGTKNVIRKCVEHEVKKLVYVSSTSAIPELPAGQRIKEVEHFSPEGIIGYYGQTKAMASQAVMDAVEAYDLDASIVFPTGICGPNDFANGPVSTFIREYVGGKMPAGIEGHFNAADVRDLADGCIACAEKGGKGQGYIMGNQLVSMREMFDMLSEKSGCKNVRTILPMSLGKLIGKLCDLKGRITGKTGRMTSFAVYNLIRNNDFDFSKAQRELGYRARPFSETIEDEIAWMIDEGMLEQQEGSAAVQS